MQEKNVLMKWNVKQQKNVISYQFKEQNILPNVSLNEINGFTWRLFWFLGGKVAQQKIVETWFMKLNLHFPSLHMANIFIVSLWYILCKFKGQIFQMECINSYQQKKINNSLDTTYCKWNLNYMQKFVPVFPTVSVITSFFGKQSLRCAFCIQWS